MSKSEIELMDYIVKILGAGKQALSMDYVSSVPSASVPREAGRTQPCFSCSRRDSVK